MGCGAIKWGFGAFYQDQGLAPFFSIKDHLLECVIAIFIFVVVLLLFDQTQLFKIRFTFLDLGAIFKILILTLSGCFFMATS